MTSLKDDKFRPGETNSCPLAKALYDMCVKNDMVTPVCRECPKFGEKHVDVCIDESGHQLQ